MAAKIKVCGLMRPEDAKIAVSSGASYLGVVFAEGPRVVSPGLASEIVHAAGGVPVLGVFTEHSVDAILQIRDLVGLSGAQLHGGYSQSEAARLRTAGMEVWRVVRIAVPSDLDALPFAIPESDAVLVEPRVAGKQGGAGVALDYETGREARRRLAGHPMVLAGGLTPESVPEALIVIGPEIVDVSSGIERAPGVKDHNKIVRFVEAVVAHSPVT
ncbi:MAG TPA: phosphoribosylanthranilate isomerase [Gemmatimonadales bacterium]|nr:phosphoribosylanthranilate isomerase [Gemmatimonadales bacterium]